MRLRRIPRRALRRTEWMSLAVLLAGLGIAPMARAQMEIIDLTEPGGGGGGGGSIACSEINNRAMEATLVVRQHASVLSLGIDTEARPQAAVQLAWLDQWTGRLRGFLDVGEFFQCLDEGDAETYRRALAMAVRVGNQARDELLRPVRTAQQRPRR